MHYLGHKRRCSHNTSKLKSNITSNNMSNINSSFDITKYKRKFNALPHDKSLLSPPALHIVLGEDGCPVLFSSSFPPDVSTSLSPDSGSRGPNKDVKLTNIMG